MARFDLYRRKNTGTLLVDCQADTLSFLASRVMAPLIAADGSLSVVKRLQPEFEIDGGRYLLATHLLLAVPVRELGPRVGSLRDHDHTILNALDMLITGY